MQPLSPVAPQRILLVNTVTSDLGLALAPGESSRALVERLPVEARAHLHRLRAEASAVVVSSRTVMTDDPRLTVRYGIAGSNPLKIVVSRSGVALPRGCLIYRDAPEPTFARIDSFEGIAAYFPKGIVHVEGGAILTEYFVRERIADEIVLAFVAGESAAGTIKFANGRSFDGGYVERESVRYGAAKIVSYERRG